MLLRFIVISGLFEKDEDLDVLPPPPPPFPEIGASSEDDKEKSKKPKSTKNTKKSGFGLLRNMGFVKTKKEKREYEKKKQQELRKREKERFKELKIKGKELEKKHKEAEKNRKEQELLKKKERENTLKLKEQKLMLRDEEKTRKIFEKIKLKEQKKKETKKKKGELKGKSVKVIKKNVKELKKNTLEFLNKTGFVQDEESKEELKKHKEEHKKRRRYAKDIIKEDTEKLRSIENVLGGKEKKTPLLNKIFGKRKKNIKTSLDMPDIPKDIGIENFEEITNISKERVRQEKSKIQEDLEIENIPYMENQEKEVVDFAKKSKKVIAKEDEISRAEEEILQAVQNIKGQKETGIKNIFKKKEKIPEIGPYSQEEYIPKQVDATSDDPDPIKELQIKMHKTRLSIMDFKLAEAKNEYMEIMGIYMELNDEDKGKVYEQIRELYYERKSAEKFA